MPQQNETPNGGAAATGPSPVAVRRGVGISGPANEPGPELGPRTPDPAAGRAAATVPGWALMRQPPGSAVAEEATAPAAAPEAQEAADGRAEPEGAAAGIDEGMGGLGGAGAEGAAVSPSNTPRKPMLAAAGIAGALLIAVPFLVMALGNDDKPKDPVNAAPVGGMTLAPGGADGPAAGYAAESPSASPSPSGSHSASRSPSPSVSASHKAAAARSASTTRPSAAQTSGAAARSQATTKAAKPSARALANAASSQTSVLLKNLTTGMCADVPGYGKGTTDGPVNQYPCNGTSGDNQLWNLETHKEAGSGPKGSVLFLIRNTKDGMCMDLPYYGAAASGTKITEYPCQATTSDNQYWWLDPRSDGTYWIRNFVSGGMCLNVRGSATGGNDTPLDIGTCNDSTTDEHHWSFV